MLSLQIGSNRLDNLEETDEVYNISYSHTFGDTLSFGNIISKTCDVEIYNITESYSHLIGQQLIVIKDNKTKYKGYIYDCSNDGEKLTINASDKVNKLDNEWKVITGKITLKDLIIRTLQQQDITYSSASFNSFPNMNFVITEAGELVNSTCREVLRLCLELVGANGFINENEEFELLFFLNKNVKTINTDELLNFKRTTDKEIIVDNVKFFRGEFEFNNNSTRNNSINLTSNNLLVEYNSQEKVQSLLNNIKLNIKYTPCEIELITNTEYKIGDYILTKYRNKNIYSYITSITSNEEGYYNIVSCKIQDNEDVLSSTDGSNNSSYGSSNMYYTEKNFIQFNECNSSTKITYSINFSTNNSGFFSISLNNNTIRQFQYKEGHNSITSMIDFNFRDTTNILQVNGLNNIGNFSLSVIYMNCTIYQDYELEDIKDLDEDGNEQIGDEIGISRIYGLMELKKNTKLLINQNYVGYNEQNKKGKDVVMYCEWGTVFIENVKDNYKVIIEDKVGNQTIYTEEDILKLKTINRNGLNFYIITIPFEMGTITEYVSRRFNRANKVIESFLLLNDDCIIRPEYTLFNLTNQSWGFQQENIITTDRFETIDRKGEFDDKLYISSGNRNDSVEIYQTLDNKIHLYSKYWGYGGVIYENGKSKGELYRKFNDVSLYCQTLERMRLLGITIDYSRVLEVSNKYDNDFYRYSIYVKDLTVQFDIQTNLDLQ